MPSDSARRKNLRSAVFFPENGADNRNPIHTFGENALVKLLDGMAAKLIAHHT